MYYYDNFHAVKSVVHTLETQDATAIRTAQDMFKDNEIEGRLAYIMANFGCLPPTITRLQEKRVTLEISIALVRKTKNALENVPGDTGKLVSSKMKRVL
jgi:hypothetical protein